VPLVGAAKVAHFLVVARRYAAPGTTSQVVDVNGGPGILLLANGVPAAVVVLDLKADGRVQTVRLVVNPDKLVPLAP
jgi:RNA polymerase sigma-70 factor (ECF subfamily)